MPGASIGFAGNEITGVIAAQPKESESGQEADEKKDFAQPHFNEPTHRYVVSQRSATSFLFAVIPATDQFSHSHQPRAKQSESARFWRCDAISGGGCRMHRRNRRRCC